MPTNDERREVAARLRDKHENWQSIKPDTWYPQTAGLSYELVYLHDLEACIPDGESIFIVLADLIDPEPEHTCKNLSSDSLFVCSECNSQVTQWNVAPNYCPNCGAKVVE